LVGGWTIVRASGVGVVAGLAALLLWPAQARWEGLTNLYLVMLTVTAVCGISILAITIFDLMRHPRGRSMRPVRGFDIALGLLLSGPSLLQLNDLL
jgi:hypothetical protein